MGEVGSGCWSVRVGQGKDGEGRAGMGAGGGRVLPGDHKGHIQPTHMLNPITQHCRNGCPTKDK